MTAEEKIQNQLAFIMELEKLKQVLRKTKPLGLERFENSAEHSWQVALLAMALAEHANESVDISKVIKLLLVHDIPEIDTGDTLVYDVAPTQEIAEKDLQAAERIFGLLPAEQAAQFLDLWKEYETRATAEARFANAMDRLMPVFQNLNNGGQSWRANNIRKSQVLEKNAKIGDGAEGVWEFLQTEIDSAVAKGFLLS